MNPPTLIVCYRSNPATERGRRQDRSRAKGWVVKDIQMNRSLLMRRWFLQSTNNTDDDRTRGCPLSYLVIKQRGVENSTEYPTHDVSDVHHLLTEAVVLYGYVVQHDMRKHLNRLRKPFDHRDDFLASHQRQQ